MRGRASECGVASLLLQLHHDSPHERMSMFRNGWPCLCNFPSIHARLISSPDCLWKQWPLGLVSQHLFCLGDRPDLQNHGRCSYLLLILQNYITICFCGLWCRCCFVFSNVSCNRRNAYKECKNCFSTGPIPTNGCSVPNPCKQAG